MTSLTEFFNKHEDETLKGISHKNSIIKRNIIAHMAVNGECTLSELTKELHISVPTITKLVQELVDENIVTDLGKVETPGGRRHPHLRTERPGPGLRLRRIGSSLPLCTRYAARASAVVQRRGRQRSEPATVPQRRIHRNRHQTRLAMAARRLSRRSDAAKDARLKQKSRSSQAPGFSIQAVRDYSRRREPSEITTS